ncbi:type VI secretion system-associated protein VasI [Shewanella khirikhana]|uniref:Type VI secretion-associated protein, VC_A0118 family n=1 Tax=Shewanella khirikhana TaxID=1965282 RepID=A0ABM7DBL0_9GAMM|nr:type VI secretion system-associated protein VasI [Shewanella khirikhana]AZQ10870.1 hypothetical protein STH12_01762 [Shewanella khirikhana]
MNAMVKHLFLWGSLWLAANAHADTLSEAKSCTLIQARLERLACFDAVFQTQVSPDSLVVNARREPDSVVFANASEALRSDRSGFIAAPSNTERDYRFTASALGALPPRPILMLSCVDDISRVELILPKAVAASKVSVTLASSNGGAMTQDWLSDDTGHIYRSGRGLVAIGVMKHVLRGNELTLSSDVEAIEGLRFDTSHLAEVIAPMRGACKW